jgi:hypothetical protein
LELNESFTFPPGSASFDGDDCSAIWFVTGFVTGLVTRFVADAFVADSSLDGTLLDGSIFALIAGDGDTFVADTFVADTFVADTANTDTFVADTFVTGVAFVVGVRLRKSSIETTPTTTNIRTHQGGARSFSDRVRVLDFARRL